jgi:hypothetical protein
LHVVGLALTGFYAKAVRAAICADSPNRFFAGAFSVAATIRRSRRFGFKFCRPEPIPCEYAVTYSTCIGLAAPDFGLTSKNKSRVLAAIAASDHVRLTPSD